VIAETRARRAGAVLFMDRDYSDEFRNTTFGIGAAEVRTPSVSHELKGFLTGGLLSLELCSPRNRFLLSRQRRINSSAQGNARMALR